MLDDGWGYDLTVRKAGASVDITTAYDTGKAALDALLAEMADPYTARATLFCLTEDRAVGPGGSPRQMLGYTSNVGQELMRLSG